MIVHCYISDYNGDYKHDIVYTGVKWFKYHENTHTIVMYNDFYPAKRSERSDCYCVVGYATRKDFEHGNGKLRDYTVINLLEGVGHDNH